MEDLSPLHKSIELPPDMKNWPFETIVEISPTAIDIWHLEVADRVINLWVSEDGEQAVKAYDAHGKEPPHIPDSGWAALQIMCFTSNERCKQYFRA